ncbi:DNA-binding transcriptional regulator, MarR family [Goodfellowiella coeruleoviolacea]|uniref:DNA-binding transcriptional regulator, MarR family n=1 Tax=Goodfellowiella coeruleoviolacea TaxID=334858 RepID=A0AAE3G7X0_9PSEU|nr:DNA-binding transcriptional regulator, MarR family [Goodfellowiella coeruleoviolacea]
MDDSEGRPGLPAPNAALLLAVLGRAVRADIDAALAECGLSMRLLSALGHLAHQPGLSYSELGRRAGVTAQSMQATFRRLEDTGAVVRTSPGGRGNTARLELTDAGRSLLRQGRQVLGRIEADLLAVLPEADGARLRHLLGELAVRRAKR